MRLREMEVSDRGTGLVVEWNRREGKGDKHHHKPLDDGAKVPVELVDGTPQNVPAGIGGGSAPPRVFKVLPPRAGGEGDLCWLGTRAGGGGRIRDWMGMGHRAAVWKVETAEERWGRMAETFLSIIPGWPLANYKRAVDCGMCRRWIIVPRCWLCRSC